MAEERKAYRYKEESPDESKTNRFWVGADDQVFYDADPLIEGKR